MFVHVTRQMKFWNSLRQTSPNFSESVRLLGATPTGWPCGEEADEAEVEAAIGGNFEALTDSERPLFDLLNTVLDCCSPDVCANHSLPPGSG